MILKQKVNLQDTVTIAYHDYAKSLNQHAFFKVSNRETAEDLVQQTFMKTYFYMVKGGEIEKMRSFLYHVLNNLIVDEYRKKKTVSLNSLIEKGFDPCLVTTVHSSDILDGKTAILLIESLPVTYRSVMYLKYVDDLTLEEISRKLGLSKTTVTVQIHRGIKKIRILYKW